MKPKDFLLEANEKNGRQRDQKKEQKSVEKIQFSEIERKKDLIKFELNFLYFFVSKIKINAYTQHCYAENVILSLDLNKTTQIIKK